MIPRFKCSVTVVSLCFGVSAFASSTSFNGYVQTTGNTGIDFNNLSGGNYKITITSTGQLNYRYQIGDQTYDSNPEASILDLTGNRDTSWQDSGSRIGAAPAPNLADTPAPAWSSSLPSNYQLMISDDAVRSLSIPLPIAARASQQEGSQNDGNTDNGFHSDPAVLGNTYGGNIDVSTLSPAAVQVPANSLVAQISDGYDPLQEPVFFAPVLMAPEPGTFVLLLAGTLAGAAILRRRGLPGINR